MWVREQKVKGIKRHTFRYISHGDTMYMIGNAVNNSVRALNGDRW